MTTSEHTLIIGGGLAGLATAALLTRAGRRTTVFEQSQDRGGRAKTQVLGEMKVNLGPHALYRGGHARRILGDLGVEFSGHVPSPTGFFAVRGGQRHTLPAGLMSLMSTTLFARSAKWEAAKLMGALPFKKSAPLSHTSARAWIEDLSEHSQVREFMGALVRLSTYSADLDRLSAEVALCQLQLAFSQSVLYLDGGWASLIDGLEKSIRDGGGEIHRGHVQAVLQDAKGGVRAIRVDGQTIEGTNAVIAASPQVAHKLVPRSEHLGHVARGAAPVRAACLDATVDQLPDPSASFGLGMDAPLYFSIHSRYANLEARGGEGRHVMSAARYLTTAPEAGGHNVQAGGTQGWRAELEALVETMQPGFREHLVDARYLPQLTVVHDLATAERGGYAGRCPGAVPDVDGLYLAGDWVGPRGWLADASFASAEDAVRAILEHQTRRPNAEGRRVA